LPVRLGAVMVDACDALRPCAVGAPFLGVKAAV